MRNTSVKIMGILNVTPDSFSDGGQFTSVESALSQALKLVDDGADIIDIGGESTRPFANPVDLDEELKRVIPVIKKIRKYSRITISIDTMKAEVAARALEAGADIINDVSAFRADPEMVKLAARTDVPIIIMHMLGTPSDMQVNPDYGDVICEIHDFFQERIQWLEQRGIAKKRLILDPGIGFGKKLIHNLTILKNLSFFNDMGLPVLLAHSRKRFLGELTGISKESERDFSTAIVAALAVSNGIKMVRVHNVAATRQALSVAEAIATA